MLTNLIDSNVLIDVRRGRPEALAWMAGAASVPFAVPGIAVLEVLSGCRDRVDMAATSAWLDGFQVIWPEPEDWLAASRLLVQYRLSHGLDIGDAILGAMALRLNARLLTLNLKHFRAIPNLDAVAPYASA